MVVGVPSKTRKGSPRTSTELPEGSLESRRSSAFGSTFSLLVLLQARNLQRKEARSAGEAWAGLKAVWSIRPKLWKTQSGHSEIAEACPELARDFPEPPVRGFGIVVKKFLRPFAWMLLGASRTPASGACSMSRPESCGTMMAPVHAGNGLTCSPALLRVSSKKLSIQQSKSASGPNLRPQLI